MISQFRGEHRFLSNFWPCRIEYEGLTYPSSENAYQAAKTLLEYNREKFLAVTPGKAKRLGKTLELRPDWEDVKLSVMEELLTIKFKDPGLRAMLLCTGHQPLVEGNNWGDTFWGVCNGKGSNHLGQLLMKIRNQLS